MWKIRLRLVFRLRFKWLIEFLCISSVFVGANNPWENGQRTSRRQGQAIGLPYRFDGLAVASTTEAPSLLPISIPLLSSLSSTPAPAADEASEAPSDPRIMQMLGMLNGKEKNWSFKKPGLFGSHNVDIKLGAQESIFCRLTKRQTVVMFSFCMQNKGGGGGQGWGPTTMKPMKGGMGWGEEKPMKPMNMGWGEEEMEEKKKKKKKGKKKKGKKKGGKKKGKGKKKKKMKGGKGGGGEEGGQGWTMDMDMDMDMEMPQKGGWGQDMKNQGWGQKNKKKGEEGDVMEKDKDSEGWSKEQEDNAEGEEESGEESTANNSDEEEEEAEDTKGNTSQDEEYQPKKGMTTVKPKVIIKAETPGSAMYMTESEYAKWEKENSYAQKDKVNAQEILYHHFYKKY